MKKIAIIVAGGKGMRAGSELPKQLVEIKGYPMIFHSIRAFKEYDENIGIIIVMNKDYISEYTRLCNTLSFPYSHTVLPGGSTRAESVREGFKAILHDYPIEVMNGEIQVAIHDAARPLVSSELIGRGFKMVRKGSGVLPAVPVVSSLRQLDRKNLRSGLRCNSHAVDRSGFVEVQTPQIFDFADILKAYTKIGDKIREFTDDASIAEAAGLVIELFEGDPTNIKVTNPMDFAIAELLLSK